MDWGNYFELRTVLYVIFALYVVLIAIKIILDNKPPEVLIAWLAVLILLPYVGGFLYLYIGVDWRQKKIMKHRPEEVFQQFLADELSDQINELNESTAGTSLEGKMKRLLLNTGGALVTTKNSFSLYHDGEPLFDQLLGDLAAATHSIHMEYYIWKSDAIGTEIKSILLEKARQGVEVRLIFDGWGSFAKISRRYRRELKMAGVQFKYFLDPRSYLNRLVINYRNHRKIVVIDGRIGYTGGMNVGQEYLDGGKQFSYWRDTHLRAEGEIVPHLQAVFLTDWHNSRGEFIDSVEYFPEVTEVPGGGVPVTAQVVCSGPDSRWHNIKNQLFSMISGAQEEILIQSPYLIPDQGFITALVSAALSGVQVHLMITGKPDKRIPFWVAETYFEPLLESGVHIYRYVKGFFHPKVMVVDRRIASVGTCNMDVRSFHLNYEINTVFYDTEVAESLSNTFLADRDDCVQIDPEGHKKASVLIRFRNSLFRIFAPLL